MVKYIGAVDQGTTRVRFTIFDHSGQIIGLDQKEHEAKRGIVRFATRGSFDG